MPVIQYESRTHPLMIVDAEYIDDITRQLLLSTATEQSLPKVRDAIRQIDDREARYQAQATAAQQAISWGQHFKYLWKPDRRHILAGSLAKGMTIYGRVYGLGELYSSEDPATMTRVRAAYGRGWRHARCYSVVCPDGEPGDTHVALMTKISKGEFHDAQAMGWPS